MLTNIDSGTYLVDILCCMHGSSMLMMSFSAEAAPAAEAGMKTSIVVRDDSDKLTEEQKKKFHIIENFTQLTSTTNGDFTL